MWEAKLEFKAPTQSFSSKLWKSSEQLFLENLLMTVSEFYLCVCVCVCVCLCESIPMKIYFSFAVGC